MCPTAGESTELGLGAHGGGKVVGLRKWGLHPARPVSGSDLLMSDLPRRASRSFPSLEKDSFSLCLSVAVPSRHYTPFPSIAVLSLYQGSHSRV